MSAHYVQQPLVRVTALLTPEQRQALVDHSAATGKPMTQLLRELVNEKYFEAPKTLKGWELSAVVRRPLDPREAPPPPRARLQEWVSRVRRRR